MLLTAVVQLNCTSDEDANFASLDALVRRAAGHGARLVATPENTNYLGPHKEKVERAEPLDGPTVGRYRQLARELGITLLIGSVNERSQESDRCYNTSVLIDPHGEIVSSYRKMHLFDVDVTDGVRFLESKTTVPGDTPVVATLPTHPSLRLGLSICYDLRFAELYRHLVAQGANVLTAPSAFTLMTGKDHWEVLLRARAIENQSYVLAPAQHGLHDDRGLRHSYGHGMIVDPWGHVVARCSDGPGIALAELDAGRVTRIRRGMPMHEHRRL